MTFQITAGYAAVLGLMMLGLFYYVTIFRAKNAISIGDGGNLALSERIRRHGNFIETVPFAVVLLAMAESGGMAPTYVHAAGIILVLARLSHPFGINHEKADSAFRIVGGIGTTVAILIAVGSILIGPFGP